MRRELIIKTRSLVGSSDLTLFAPIKPGLVPSLESVTYKTRVKRLLKTLNAGRSSSHEFALLRPFSDAVERVGRIHSVRVAVLEPEDKVLLAATFDGPWESYIRVLWQKVGTLLDVIFCNTVDYVSAYDHTFEEWVGWANRVQIETAFFYGMPGVTVDDVRYLKNQEALHREVPAQLATDLESTRRCVQRVESVAWDVTLNGHFKVYPETAKLGLQALAALYRLTDLYLPGSEDGKYLHRAARELLLEFVHLKDTTDLLTLSLWEGRIRFEKQLAWLSAEPEPASGRRKPLELPTNGRPPAYDADDVQGGILGTYEGITHGAMLLIAFDNPAAAAEFLAGLIPRVTRDSNKLKPGELVCNVAFTYEGLRTIGLSEAQLGYFPQEFREGMEARASVLGDFRINHPRRWRLPVRNWPSPAGNPPERIELTAVHAVVQLRVGTKDEGQLKINELDDANHPLHGEVNDLFPEAEGPRARVLAVQPMRRYSEAGMMREHFGFPDGESDPVIDPNLRGKVYRNQVHLGELLLGYDNEADGAPDAKSASHSLAALERMQWLGNGSFLVVRKLKQDVEALEQAVAAVVRPGLTREQVLGKMMGRTEAGEPLVPKHGAGKNDFDYKFDEKGSRCPFQAHIRRANPRQDDPSDVPEPPGRRAPRMMRRGMSYGPRYEPKADDAGAREINAMERGLVFMAYNASISEQFEVVQRWVSGGNSTGVFSGQGDPFLGVAQNAEPRYFRFEHDGEVVRMAMDGWDALLEKTKPIVRLEWGAYLFTPSITALGKLKQVAERGECVPAPAWSVADGLLRITALEALEREKGPKEAAIAWKSVLEDPEAQEKFISASVWAAIREHRGGVMRTPYGVIIADRDLVMKVLQNAEGDYSVSGYHDRMDQSMGEIYLGLDATGDDGPYATQSKAANAAIGEIQLDEAFLYARESTGNRLGEFIKEAQDQAHSREDSRWELTLDVREVLDKVLADLCEIWFGVSEGKHLKRGGTRWDWTPELSPPLYPGNFTAPSRYIFQPHPGASVEEFGRRYGSTLSKALELFISDLRAAKTRPTSPLPGNKPAPIGDAIFGPADNLTPVDLAARTFVGALMGFLPTVDGNLRLTLNEWLRDGTFWSLRAALAGRTSADVEAAKRAAFLPHKFVDAEDAKSLLLAPLKQAMQLRPSPELVWRTATRRHSLGKDSSGKVWVEADETVVLSIVSATQQCLAEGKLDVFPIFGGDRSQTNHPTHACPAYKAGMGVILGVLSALLEVKESMRPGALPLAFVFEGPSPGREELTSERKRHTAVLRERQRDAASKPEAHRKAGLAGISAPVSGLPAGNRRLLAWGDSWLHYVSIATSGPSKPSNVAEFLATQEFNFPLAPFGNSGLSLKTMALELNRTRFRDALEQMLLIGQAPRAILLSGGGNDVVRQRLLELLHPAPNAKPLIDSAVKALVDGELRGHYIAILGDIKAVCDAQKQAVVPVLIHAYAHPIPDGRFFLGNEGNLSSWLYPYITKIRGYDLKQGTDIMRELINRLYKMQEGLRQDYGNVIPVGPPGTFDDSATHKDFWENELHPTRAGFKLIGQKFVEVLNGL